MGGTTKCTPKRHERFGDPAERDCQEEGERQYWMYRSDQRERRMFARPLAKARQVERMSR